jgi:hypothetical protein
MIKKPDRSGEREFGGESLLDNKKPKGMANAGDNYQFT